MSESPSSDSSEDYPIGRGLSPIDEEETSSFELSSEGQKKGQLIPANVPNPYQNLTASEILKIITASFDTLADLSEDEIKLVKSIASAPALDKVFARRVAESSILLQDWCAEIETWPWTGTFETPSDLLILQHDKRLKEICDDLSELDLGDQRAYVLELHPTADEHELGSKKKGVECPPDDDCSPCQVDNLNMLVTTTFVQGLPFHVRLVGLMQTWRVRIQIASQVPALIEEINDAKNSMRKAWKAIGYCMEPGVDSTGTIRVQQGRNSIGKDEYARVVANLQRYVTSVGQHLDDMLDILDNQEDVLPDEWVDGVDSLEQDLEDWVRKARKRVQTHEARVSSMYQKRRDRESREMLANAAAAASAALMSTHHIRCRPMKSYGSSSDEETDGDVDTQDMTTLAKSTPIFSARASRQDLKKTKSPGQLPEQLEGASMLHHEEPSLRPFKITRKPVPPR